MRPRTRTRAFFATVLFTTMLAVLAFGWTAAAAAVDPGYPFWTRAYTGAGNQLFTQVAGCPGGDVLVAGTTDPAVQHVVLARYSPSGARRWLRVVDPSNTTDDWSPRFAVDRSGNAVVIFTRTIVPNITTKIVVCKYNPKGRRLWKRTLDGGVGSLNSGVAVALNGAGDAYVGGNITTTGPAEGSLVARLRARDGKVMMKSWQSGAGKLERVTGLVIDGKGYAYTTGHGDRGDGHEQVVTIKVRPNGTVAWSKRFPGTGDYETTGSHIVLGAGGRLYVVARQRLLGPTSTLIVLRYSTSGTALWNDAWDVPGGNMDGVSAVATDRYGNLFLAGEAATSGPDPSHAFVARWTPSKARWTWVKPSTDDDATDLNGVVVDQTGGCWAAGGYTFAHHTGSDVTGLYAVRVSKTGSLRWEQAQVRIGRQISGGSLAGCSGGLAVAGWSWVGGAYDGVVTKIHR